MCKVATTTDVYGNVEWPNNENLRKNLKNQVEKQQFTDIFFENVNNYRVGQ